MNGDTWSVRIVMADECVLWDVGEMTVLPAQGEIRAEGGDTGCFEWSRKI